MKNSFKAILLVGLGLLSGATAVNAQQADQRVTFKAPFDFQVENGRLPAGEYTVLMQGGWVQIQATNGKSNANALALPVGRSGKHSQESAQVVFHQYKDRYFLAEVWATGVENGRALLESQDEKAAAKEQKMVSVHIPLRTGSAK